MNKVLKATVGLMVVTMMSKVLGFFRETVLVAVYGTSITADAYIVAMNIPNVIFATIGAALGTTFIPLFFEIEKESGKDKALKFANNIFNIVIVISIIISIFGWIFAEPLTRMFAIDFDGEKLKIATNFTKIIIFGIIPIGLMNIITCWLQIKGNYIIPGIVGIPYNILIIASILLSANGNLKILGIGTLVGIIGQFVCIYPFAVKEEFKYKLYINLKDKYLKKMFILIIPVFIGVGVNQLNVVIDRSLASTLGDGIITVLNSANRLNSFITGILVVGIVSVVYPILSKISTDNDESIFINTVTKCINIIILLIIPISIGAIILSEPVVRLVYERGQFSSDATTLTSIALKFYSIGMIGFGIREILNRIFYSMKDTKTPMINGAISMIMNIVLNLILIKFMGYAGLAFATSISSLICVVLLFNRLKKKIGYFGQDKIFKTTIKCLISSFVMGIVTKYTYNAITTNLGTGKDVDIISLALSVLVGMVVYILLVILLKVEEVSSVKDMVRSKVGTVSGSNKI